MTKNFLKIIILSVFVFASCSKEDSFDEISVDASQKDPLTAQQVNAQIDEAIATKGSFSWKNASNHLLWSSSFRGNHIITIGFGNSATDFDRSKSCLLYTSRCV